jgi:serine/threonine-protein kinase
LAGELTTFPTPYGKYELLERIGDGGMAEVFRARLPGLAGFEKIVVIKRILPHLSRKKRFVDMFVREATLAAQLTHKNVVQVFELGQLENGELYMAMEYVKGTDLRRILTTSTRRSLRIPPWFSAFVMSEVLDALSHAHHLVDDQGAERTILHRDVTPSNVFISWLGEVKLGDFGLARDDSLRSLTRPGQRKGKLSYMSPEQVNAADLDERADVFAAGVVLWECLTQRRLFGGKTELEVANMILDPNRPPPSRYLKDIPDELDRIVLSSLEPDREKRMPSARVFQSRLLDVLPKLNASIRTDDIRHMVDKLMGEKQPPSLEENERSTIANPAIRFEELSVSGSGPLPSTRSRGGSKSETGIAVRATPKTGPTAALARAPLPLPNTGDDFWVRAGGEVPPRLPPAAPLHHGLYHEVTPQPTPSPFQNLSEDLVLDSPLREEELDEIEILEPVEAESD